MERIETAVSTYMTREQLDFFRQLLENELDELRQKAGIAIIELLGATADGAPDPLDRASLDSCHKDKLRIRSRESRLIKKIEASLEAIEDGTYGICLDCEEPISIERLKARPMTNYCIVCKNRREAYEKLTG